MSLASVVVGRLRASVVNTWIAQINRLTLGASDDVFSSRGGCTLSTTSASYVDVTNASKAFTKVGSSSESDLLVELSVCCYATAAPTVVKFAVQVNGTDNEVVVFSINTANIHMTFPVGAVRITGLAASGYTVKARALRVSGAGTVTIDSSDTVTMVLKERPL
jgi:hypothetical protein